VKEQFRWRIGDCQAAMPQRLRDLWEVRTGDGLEFLATENGFLSVTLSRNLFTPDIIALLKERKAGEFTELMQISGSVNIAKARAAGGDTR
jgi:hypothetical protein